MLCQPGAARVMRPPSFHRSSSPFHSAPFVDTAARRCRGARDRGRCGAGRGDRDAVAALVPWPVHGAATAERRAVGGAEGAKREVDDVFTT